MAVQARKPSPSPVIEPTRSSSTQTHVIIPSPLLPPPTSPYSRPYLLFLLLSAFTATLYSISTQSTQVQSFRSRLPASTLSSTTINDFLPPSAIPYFADKRNLFNQYFVKLGWGWTCLLWSIFVLTSSLFPPRGLITTTPQVLLPHFRRFLLASSYWYYLTQATWFLIYTGPSISHSLLIYSGAQCVPSAIGSQTVSSLASGELSQPVCTGSNKGEYFRGGHDVSGHTFMMIHASLFLLETISPYLPLLFTFLKPYPSTSSSSSSSSSSSNATSYNSSKPLPLPTKVTMYAILSLMGLWWWMLLMTSTYFHTPGEKVTGALFAIGGWWVSSGAWR